MQFAEQCQARLGDANADDTAIVAGPIALDQAALLQLVEQPRDVGSARHKPAGEIERVDLLRMSAAQEPQGVVLLRRQVMLAEEFVLEGAQAVIGAPEVEEHFLLQRVETPAFRRRACVRGCHACQYIQCDNTCPDNYCGT